MNIKLKGNNIVLSITPEKKVERAFLIETQYDILYMDALVGQKKYELPEKVEPKDVKAVYLRVL